MKIPTPKLPEKYEPKAWAWRLRHREQMCERLSMAQREMWRAALKDELQREKESVA